MDENRSMHGTEVLEERQSEAQERARKPGLSTADLVGSTPEVRRGKESAARERGGAASDAGAQDGAAEEERVALLPEQEIQGFRGRWETIQTGFVDSPRLRRSCGAEEVGEGDGVPRGKWRVEGVEGGGVELAQGPRCWTPWSPAISSMAKPSGLAQARATPYPCCDRPRGTAHGTLPWRLAHALRNPVHRGCRT